MDITRPDSIAVSLSPLRVLIVEDNPRDAKLMAKVLEGGGFKAQFEVTDLLESFRERLETAEYDVILADFNLRNWTAHDALEILRRSGKDIPLIVVTGSLGDEAAVECIKQGAADFVLKDRPARLPTAVQRALEEKRLRAENKRTFGAISRLATIVESSEDAIIGKTLEGVITSWNKGAEKLYGYSAAEVLGQPVSILLPPDRSAEVAQILASLRQSALIAPFESIRVRKDGSRVNVSLSMFPLTDSGGEVTGLASIARDITERKRAEETLQKSEERFRQIAETIDEVYWIADPRITKISYISPGYERVWGRSPASLFEDPRAFLESIHPQDLKGVLRQVEIMMSGKPFDCEFRIIRPDGVNSWVWCRGFPVHNEKGEVIHYVGVGQDITERKRAEGENIRLMTAIEQAAEGVVVTDAEGAIEYVNPAFSAMTGYSREEVLGKNPRILKSGKQDAAFYANLWATLLAGQVWRGEMINRRKDGSLYTEKMSITPVRDEHGKMTHLIAMKEDITAGRLLEDQFRQAQKMEAVGRLAAGVAHDFNNLLTIIIGYSDVMLDRFVSGDPLRAYTTEIRGAGERAVGLTRQLLAFSRQQVLALQVLDLNNLIPNLTKLLRRLIGEDIDLAFTPGPSPATVKADPGHIEQVLMNLAVNSRDAMPRGGKLTVETSHVQVDEAYGSTHYSMPAGSYVMLSVSDTGCGMDKDTQAHIFEPFFTTKETGKGTGLGLATVYGIVKQSGGHIWVYSEPGAGTTFKIYLPAVTGTHEAAKVSAVPAGGSETILLVEDDASLRALARMILEARGGYKVLESPGGKEARLFAEQHKGPIHLLLTDVVMPGMSGRELSEELATLRPEMKILYMSGYTDDTVVRHGVLEEGMAFLQKPFTAESLLRKVRNVLDTRISEVSGI